MKKETKVLLLAMCAFALAGCGVQTPKGKVLITRQPDTCADYRVTFLFEADGVRVYRFQDYGHSVYFTNANGNTRYSYTHRTGKVATTTEGQSVNSSTHDPDCPCREKGGER